MSLKFCLSCGRESLYVRCNACTHTQTYTAGTHAAPAYEHALTGGHWAPKNGILVWVKDAA